MPEYVCEICKYSTKIRNQLFRHQSTNKHITNMNIINHKHMNENDTLISSSKITHFSSKITQFPSKTTTNSVEILNHKKYTCNYCSKEYSRKDNLKRHLLKDCKEQNIIIEENNQLNELIELQKLKIKDLVKNGNTINSNNIQINVDKSINLNYFGKENLEMITDDVKKELIKGPFKMMSKLMKLVYFNKKYPENHTLKMVNKNKDVMKIHNKNGWELVDKKDTVEYILEDKNYEVDSFYDDNVKEFSQFANKTYINFRKLFDSRDKELWKQIKRDVDLLLWNNM